MFGLGKKPTPPKPRTAAEDQGPPGEAEAVIKIKHLCWMAGMSAESVAADKRHVPPDQWDTYEHERYTKLRIEALKLADTLTDEFYRSAAIHFIIDASMKADDVEGARALFKHVEVDIIREKIAEAYPQLLRPNLSSLIRNR